MNLAGRGVLVTGASRGIGAELARQFAAAGARVAVVARSGEALEKLAAEVGGSAHTADLADRWQVDGLIGRIEAYFGPIDVLVNNAGIDAMGYFAGVEADELDRILRVNLAAPIELSRQAVPRMLERGEGHIVNVSSMSSVAVFPGLTLYSATKAGLSHFTAGLRADLRGLPIGTTLVEMAKVVPTDMSGGLENYRPTRQSFERFEKLGLLADTSVEKLAAAVVDGVQRNKKHVRLPKRAAAFPATVELPRRVTELLLKGVRPRLEDGGAVRR